jgi:hypothetical protein
LPSFQWIAADAAMAKQASLVEPSLVITTTIQLPVPWMNARIVHHGIGPARIRKNQKRWNKNTTERS